MYFCDKLMVLCFINPPVMFHFNFMSDSGILLISGSCSVMDNSALSGCGSLTGNVSSHVLVLYFLILLFEKKNTACSQSC